MRCIYKEREEMKMSDEAEPIGIILKRVMADIHRRRKRYLAKQSQLADKKLNDSTIRRKTNVES